MLCLLQLVFFSHPFGISIPRVCAVEATSKLPRCLLVVNTMAGNFFMDRCGDRSILNSGLMLPGGVIAVVEESDHKCN